MLESGAPVTPFQLPDINGKPTALESLLDQGPVVLVFFKVSCPVCQYALPFLDRVAISGAVNIVGISQDGPEATEDFRRSFDVGFSMLLDRAEDGYTVSNAFRITHVPSVFVVEKDGRISLFFSGFDRRALEQLGHRFHANVFHAGEKTPDFRPG